jgi:hypothetical protein
MDACQIKTGRQSGYIKHEFPWQRTKGVRHALHQTERGVVRKLTDLMLVDMAGHHICGG